MKALQILIFGILLFPIISSGQTSWKAPFEEVKNEYYDCAAIFFDDEMLVDEYSPKGVCKLEAGKKGDLYVATVKLTDKGGFAKEQIPFQVAIRNIKTNTMRMFSNKVYMKIYIDDILFDCSDGDEIIILTTNKKYALSHNAITIPTGC